MFGVLEKRMNLLEITFGWFPFRISYRSGPMPEAKFMNEQFVEGFLRVLRDSDLRFLHTNSLNHREGGMVSLRFPSFLFTVYSS